MTGNPVMADHSGSGVTTPGKIRISRKAQAQVLHAHGFRTGIVQADLQTEHLPGKSPGLRDLQVQFAEELPADKGVSVRNLPFRAAISRIHQAGSSAGQSQAERSRRRRRAEKDGIGFPFDQRTRKQTIREAFFEGHGKMSAAQDNPVIITHGGSFKTGRA